MKKTYKLRAKVFLYGHLDPWHLTRIDEKNSAKIVKDFETKFKGWRSLPVEVSLRKSRWKTSIFLDKRSGTFLLPLKAKVRKENGIFAGDTINYSLNILV